MQLDRSKYSGRGRPRKTDYVAEQKQKASPIKSVPTITVSREQYDLVIEEIRERNKQIAKYQEIILKLTELKLRQTELKLEQERSKKEDHAKKS
jgi:hypothetical protein